MTTLPEELRQRIPRLYQTRQEADPTVWAKFFAPTFSWRWYIIECDEVAGVETFYGWMVGMAEPAGRLVRTDLKSIRSYFGIFAELDSQFTPSPLSFVRVREERLQRILLGRFVITPGALAAFEATEQQPDEYLNRHFRGDWGELDADDIAENEFSLARGLRLLSAYRLKDGTKIWIITEADRSVTTLLLPAEY